MPKLKNEPRPKFTGSYKKKGVQITAFALAVVSSHSTESNSLFVIYICSAGLKLYKY